MYILTEVHMYILTEVHNYAHNVCVYTLCRVYAGRVYAIRVYAVRVYAGRVYAGRVYTVAYVDKWHKFTMAIRGQLCWKIHVTSPQVHVTKPM